MIDDRRRVEMKRKIKGREGTTVFWSVRASDEVRVFDISDAYGSKQRRVMVRGLGLLAVRKEKRKGLGFEFRDGEKKEG